MTELPVNEQQLLLVLCTQVDIHVIIYVVLFGIINDTLSVS